MQHDNINFLKDHSLKMTYILLISRKKDVFKALESVFAENKMSFKWTDTAQGAVELLSKRALILLLQMKLCLT